MPLTTRVIPLLHLKNDLLVKGIHLEGLRTVGAPEQFALKYYQEGADELILIDLVASLYQRPFNPDIVRKVSEDIFVPFTVGGGVRSVDDARKLLLAGADKVAVNTAAVKNPVLISRIADVLGCQSVVLYVEAKKRDWGWEVMTDNAREKTGLDVVEWVAQGVEMGAGEALVTSIDQEGTQAGVDHNLIHPVSSQVSVPVIAHGGVGKIQDIIAGLKAGAAAVAMSSLFHYHYLDAAVRARVDHGNIQFLKGERGNKPDGVSIGQVKNELVDAGYWVRPAGSGLVSYVT